MALLGLPAEERLGSMHRFELRSGRSASSPSLLHKGQAGYPRSVAVPRQPVTAFQARESVTSARMEPMVLANPVTTNDLEDRLRRRERCFGTLRASWRVKNCFSVWRSFVQMQNEAVRVQQDHEAQLRAIFDLRELLAQKEQEVRQLSVLVRTGERKRSSLERSVHVMHTGALDLVLRTRAFGAWRFLSLRDRLAGTLQRVEAEAVQREADLERQLLLQLEDASSNNRRLEAELRSSERRQRVLAEEIAALQRQLDEAEAQLRKARQRHAANSDRLAMAGTEREAKAAAWALWLRALAVLRRERHEREVMEHQQALKDAAERHRCEMEEWRRDADDDRHRRESDWRSHHEKLESSWHKKLKQAEEEWERRLQQRLAEMEADFERQHALSQDQHHQAIRGNQDVFDLELARVHQAHEDQRKLREEEDRVQAEKHQLFLEELQRQQDEAKQKLLMSSLAALGGQRTQGLRSAYFLAWAQYLAHVKRDRSAEETLLSLDRKDQELRHLLAQHDALHQKLQEQEAASARQRTSHRQQALRRSDRLLGGPGLSPKEKLWISQVLGAWLLVAVAMRLARARELEASEADQLRAELQRLKVEGGKALRSQARETLETRRRQALLLQILRSWMRVVWQQHLQAHRSETDEMSKLLRSRKDLLLHRTCEAFGRKLRRHLLWTMFQSWRSRVDVSADALGSRQSYEVKMDRLGRQLLLRASSVLLTSSFTAWSRTARLLRFDRAAQQMLSKVDFLQRWGQSRRDHLLDKSEDLGRLCLARVALAVWSQEARGAQLEKQRRTWSSELRRRADRGSNCGSRLAGKFWTLKMRLLVFATFMTWRLRLVNESSAKLRRTMADREAAEHAGASRNLLLTDAFRRWRRFANARAAERAAQLSAPAPGAPGRVVSVVSAIEERRTRVLALEAFHRWMHHIRREKASPRRSPTAVRPAYQVLEACSSPPSVVRTARCPVCGNVYMTDSVFCRKCGRKRDLLSLDLSRPLSVTLPAAPPMPGRVVAPCSPVTTALPAEEVSSPRTPGASSHVVASIAEGQPLHTPDVRSSEVFLRAEPVTATTQMRQGVAAHAALGAAAPSLVHSPGCDNFIAVPRPDLSRMPSPDQSPIRLGGLRLGEARPTLFREPTTPPAHLAGQGSWDPSLGPAVWQATRPLSDLI